MIHATKFLLVAAAWSFFALPAPAAPSYEVSVVLGTVKKPLSPKDRYGVARRLSDRLTSEDQEALKAYLFAGRPVEFHPSMWRAYASEILSALASQKKPLPGFPAVLRRLFENPETDPGVRDYAVQHLVAASRMELTDAEKSDLVEVLEKAAQTPGATYRGTAALAALRLSQDSAIPEKRALELTESILEAQDLNDAELAGSLIASVALKSEKAAPFAIRVLARQDAAAPLRLAAIRVLAESPSLADAASAETALKAVAASPRNEIEKNAADAALESLQSR